MTRPPLPRALLTLLPLLLLLNFTASAQDINNAAVTGGVQNFIEFTQVIPSMNTLLANVWTIMGSMDVAGVADTLARVIAGAIAVMTFAVAWFNYGFGRRINVMGMDGSFNNMLLAGMTVILISTGVPRILGEAGWAVWRVTYTSVEQRTYPVMDRMIKKQTAALAGAVWQYAVTGLSAGIQPMVAAANFVRGDQDISKTSAAGAANLQESGETVNQGVKANRNYAAIWQFGSLLIAGMFMAYIGVIFGSALFVIFAATFMPIAFAFIPINSGVIFKQVGGMASSILVAGVAPGLMLANVMIVFSGPIAYLTNMMKNQTVAAQDNAAQTQGVIDRCVKGATDGNLAEKLIGKVTDAVNPLDGMLENACVVGLSGLQTLFTLGQAAVFMIVGLVVAGMLFIGLSGLSMMIFREFKGVLDSIFASGGSVGQGSSGAASRMASQMGNRVAGAAIATAGVMSGNAPLAAAGARSVASGNNALGNAVSGLAEKGRENRTQQQRTQQQQQADQRQREEFTRRQQEQTERTAENRAYSETLYTQRQEAGRATQDRGEGSQTDPRSASSGGSHASEAQGGAQASNPGDNSRSTPSKGKDDDDDYTPPPSGGGGGGNGGGGSGGSGGSSGGGNAASSGGSPQASSQSGSGGNPGPSASSGPSGTSQASAAQTSAAAGGAAVGTAAAAGAASAPRSPQAGSGSSGGQAGPSQASQASSAAPASPNGAPGPNNVNLDAGSGQPPSQGRTMMNAQAQDTSAPSGQNGSTTGPNNVNLDAGQAQGAQPTGQASIPPFNPQRGGGAGAASAADQGSAPQVSQGGAAPASQAPSAAPAAPQPQSAGTSGNTSSSAPTTPSAPPAASPAPSAAPTPAPANPAPSAPSPSPSPAASPAPQGPLYFAEGNRQARASGMSAQDRDTRAVDEYHGMLNAQSSAQGSSLPPISREQAQWDLQRRGMLPSVQDENDRRVAEYTQRHGVSAHEAQQTLTEQRGLAQHDAPTPPRPTGGGA